MSNRIDNRLAGRACVSATTHHSILSAIRAMSTRSC
jgi:hypothetical protein